MKLNKNDFLRSNFKFMIQKNSTYNDFLKFVISVGFGHYDCFPPHDKIIATSLVGGSLWKMEMKNL